MDKADEELWQAAPAEAATSPSTPLRMSDAAMPQKEMERVLGSRDQAPEGSARVRGAHECRPSDRVYDSSHATSAHGE